MKDARTGKKVFFAPLFTSATVADSVDPGFITAVESNGGANDIVVQRMCDIPRAVLPCLRSTQSVVLVSLASHHSAFACLYLEPLR